MCMVVMSRWLLLALLAVVATADENSDVLEFDSDSFQDGIADKDIVLVEFYAPWCGHCKRLAPEYEKAATTLAADDPPIPLAKVDCPANNALCSEYGVTGYPTLKIFRGGEYSSDYQGPRSAEGIVSYMRKQAGPSARELSTMEDVKKFLDSTEHSVIGFFTEEETKLRKAFTSVADTLRDNFRFAFSTAKEVMDEYKYSDQVVLFQPAPMQTKMEAPSSPYEGDPTSNDIKEWIRGNFMGLAGVRNADNMMFFEAKKPLVVAYYDVDYTHNAKGSNYWRNRVIKVAKEFVGRVSFSVSSKSEMSRETEALGLDSSAQVTVGLYDSNGKYAMTEDFSVDNLKAFVQQYLDGELEIYVKSEPIPEDNSGPVKVVVGKNFADIVNDDTKDVLIEFYAPWCGHCKALAPKYEELGEKLKDDPNIVIAKSDATANDYPPSYEVRGYPTIYWVPAGSKDKPQKYEGGREVSDFIDFLKKNASNQPVTVAGGNDEDAKDEKKKKKKAKKEEL